MKLEVIGWTYDTDRHYPDHRGDSGAVLRAVVNALRAGGYRFGGNTHQDALSGTPVLNDGTKACYSWRGWGGVMAKALEMPNENGYAYTAWYMDSLDVMLGGERRNDIVLPPWGVDDSKIKKRAELSELFEMHLCPAAFEAVKSGKKTAEIRLLDDKRDSVCRGDVIEFLCGEERCRVRVTKTDIYRNFERLFLDEMHYIENDREYRHRCSLLKRARFRGGETRETLRGYLNGVYPEAEQKKYMVCVISFKLLEAENPDKTDSV